MNGWTGAAVTGLVVFVVLRGMITRCDPYSAFLSGAEKGMKSAAALLPALCGMLMMLSLINASGLAEMAGRLAGPVIRMLHLPEEVVPLLLLRPLTGAGSLAALETVYERCGVDSRAARIASVLMGSSETIFYTMTIYLGAAGVKRLPWVLGVSLTSYLCGAALCGWLM